PRSTREELSRSDRGVDHSVYFSFAGSKEKQKTPLKSKRTDPSLPKIPTTRTERRGLQCARIERLCRERRSLNARWIPDARPGDFRIGARRKLCGEPYHWLGLS